MNETEQKLMEDYLRDLAELAKQRDEIDGKMSLKEKAIRAHLGLIEDSEEERFWENRLRQVVGHSGRITLTEAVRRIVFGAGPKGLTAREVRDAVVQKYDSLQDYNNPLAAVHTVLKRLCNGVDIEQFEREGIIAYRPADWIAGV